MLYDVCTVINASPHQGSPIVIVSAIEDGGKGREGVFIQEHRDSALIPIPYCNMKRILLGDRAWLVKVFDVRVQVHEIEKDDHEARIIASSKTIVRVGVGRVVANPMGRVP